MDLLARLPARWSNAPVAILLVVAFLLLAGIGVIVQNEAAYRALQQQETRVQAEILAASVAAAVDFGDVQAARESIEALRVNRQVRTIGIYGSEGQLIAGYGRDGHDPPARLDQEPLIGAAAVRSVVPVMSEGEAIGSVLLASDPEPLGRRLARYLLIGLLVIMAALVIAVLGVTQNALRRINRQLEERAEALVRANAELKVQISERARAEEELRQSQKLQALGQLTGGIAHDFNNLLTVIQGSADILRRPALEDAKRIKFADAVVQASSRAAALTGQLLAFARKQPLQPELIDVNELIAGMTDLLDRTLGELISIETDLCDEVCPVEADRAQLESALLNIAVNARDAMPEGGVLKIRTSRRSSGDGSDLIALSVIDDGTGMDEETLGRAIEPFFTTKSTGKGTGLGLSQVYGFATQSGGNVEISSEAGLGTTVTVVLPCSQWTIEGTAKGEAGRSTRRRTGRILLVEDNEEVGGFARSLLEETGYEVVWARTGEQALDAVGSGRFDAVFSDVVMPGMGGIELAETLERSHPGLPVILTTGYSDRLAATGAGGRPVILKPYRLETLTATLDQLIDPRGKG